jgi:hypothetical protein
VIATVSRFLYLLRLSQAAKQATPRTPPDDLFRPGDAQHSSSRNKARGRTGPRSHQMSSSTDLSFGEILSAAFTPLLSNMVHNLAHTSPSTPHRRKRALSINSSPIPPPSSPLLLQPNDLVMCLEAFGHAKSIDSIVIENAYIALSAREYMPDILELTGIDHLARIVQISEGQAAALIKFSKRWISKTEAERRSKRAKRV